VLVALILSLPLAAFADDAPATPPGKREPASKPSTHVETIARLLDKLTADDFTTRDSARLALMALKREDLSDVREAVRRSLPLQPSQIVVLRDVVTHVYLSGDPYEGTEDGSGFLGVSLPSAFEDRGLMSLEQGVAIVARVPGFCAYRALQNGDVVLSMKAPGGVEVTFGSTEQFIATVQTVRAGQSVSFDVLREGKVVTVQIKLDRRPNVLDPNRFGNRDALRTFMSHRADEADELWDKDFAPLLGEKVG
jgi:hypothetical protein